VRIADDRTDTTDPETASEPTPRRARAYRIPHFSAWLTVVTLGGLALRLTFTWFGRRHQPIGKLTDNRWYWAAGKMIATGWGFGNPFVWGGQHRYVPSAGHPPVYPVFLGTLSWLGIETPFEQRLGSCVLGAVAIVFLALAAREIAGDIAGMIAAVLAALYANLWINDAALLSETPYVVLISLFLWSAIRCWKRPTWGRFAWMSLWIGLASLTRSEAIFLYPLAVVPIALRIPNASWSRRFKMVGVAALTAAIVIGPWVIYNNTGRFKHHIFIVTGSGVAMTFGDCDAGYSGTYLGYWSWTCGIKGFQNTDDETVLDTEARKEAQHYVRTHLGELPKVTAARVGRLFQVYRVRQSIQFDTFFERRGRWPSRIALWQYYPITLLAIAGAVVMWRRKLPISPWVALTISVIVAAALTFGVTRYRAGFDAAAVVLAAVALDAAIRWTRRRLGAENADEGLTLGSARS